MIAFVKGEILTKRNGYLIVKSQDLGYKVFVASALYSEIQLAQSVELFTYQNVREDSLDLYGFQSLDDLEMFEMLLSVSGIGPKSALSVMSMADTEYLKTSIIQGDSGLLTKVSGIGKKTAERVVLELKEKIAKLAPLVEGPQLSGMSSDEIDALISLGYSLPQAREALREVDSEVTDSSERIRQALKKMSH